jgi:hypothetical protein
MLPFYASLRIGFVGWLAKQSAHLVVNTFCISMYSLVNYTIKLMEKFNTNA